VGTYPIITLSDAGASDFQLVARPTSPYVRPADGFNVGLICAVSPGASLNYSVQVTSDPNPSNAGNWVDHDVLTDLTFGRTSNLAYGVTAYRLFVNSYFSGSVTLGASWW
jgi:hypothetical protein